VSVEVSTRPAAGTTHVADWTRRRERREPVQVGVLSLPVALLVAVLAGMVFALAFPAANVWVLAFPGVGGMLLAFRGRGFWSGALVGFTGGLAFWFTLIFWLTLFLGAAPLVALGALEALFMGLGGGLIALAYRSVPLLWASRWGRVGLTPLVVALAWTARESVSSTWPYGGFSWGRIAFSQSTGPFAPLAAWFGLTGLTFVLAWLTAFALAVALERPAGFAPVPAMAPRRADVVLPRLLAVAVAAGLVLAIPPFRPTEAGVLRIAGVQPVTHSAYFDPQNDPSKNLDATVQATLPVLSRGAQLIVWPEGASEGNPYTDPSIRARFDAVATLAGAPLLTGAITQRDGVYYNSSILWTPGADLATAQVYDKVHPVPFAEYVPDRAFWTPFAPDLLKLIGRDYAKGTRSPVLDVGGVKVGVDICFDIADDGLIVGSVADGARVLVAQTNNADFGTTEENEQQLAIARLRAIETGRSVVTVSTVASTAYIAPDGTTIAAAKPFTREAMLEQVPLATGTTPAVAFGIGLGITLALLGAVLPLIAALLARPLRRRP
jgi:apolipoprotein N-acyltransferase